MTGRHDRTVLTTGANSGIGLATVMHLARLGFRSVGSVRSEAKATEVAKAAASTGCSVDTVLLDITDAERCAAVIDELHPWAIVNDAGYSGSVPSRTSPTRRRAISLRQWSSHRCG